VPVAQKRVPSVNPFIRHYLSLADEVFADDRHARTESHAGQAIGKMHSSLVCGKSDARKLPTQSYCTKICAIH